MYQRVVFWSAFGNEVRVDQSKPPFLKTSLGV